MSLSQMAEAPNRAAPKAPRGDVAADRKSALSTSIPMTSSAALALGGLGKVSAKKHSGSNERSSTESVVPGANPPAAIPRGNIGASNSVSDNPKPVKAATRQSGSRSRGPDAKSVISGLNSSSSASALLAPMLQGQPKRRSGRPEGGDVA